MTPNPQRRMVREGIRGDDQQQNHMFSYLSPEACVRNDHPLRAIRAMVDEVLLKLSRRFDTMYARVGRPSIAQEKPLRAQLLYSIRNERLYGRDGLQPFVPPVRSSERRRPRFGMRPGSRNRDRLMEAEVAKEFLSRVVEQARSKGLTSDEHFRVDGTLLEARASLKSFQPKQGMASPPDDPGNFMVNFRGEKRPSQMHESKTDPEALLARKSQGKESKLSFSGNLLVGNRNGLIVGAEVFQANGTAERDAALVMLEQIPGAQPVTVVHKSFDTFGFVEECRNLGVVPHVAQNDGRRGSSAIDGRTTGHSCYALSQRLRPRRTDSGDAGDGDGSFKLRPAKRSLRWL
jgi:transposase